MTNEMRSFVEGILSSLVFWAQIPKSEPVVYSYNGVQLPDIYSVYTPELQKTHPFAVIIEHHSYSGDFVGYSINLFAEKNYFEHGGAEWFGYDEETPKLVRYKVENDEWVLHSNPSSYMLLVSKDGAGYETFNIAAWTNFDLYYSDGSIYCAASDPVPVYE